MDKTSYWSGYNGALEMVERYVEEHKDYDGAYDAYDIAFLQWIRSKKMVNIEPEKYELVRKSESEN